MPDLLCVNTCDICRQPMRTGEAVCGVINGKIIKEDADNELEAEFDHYLDFVYHATCAPRELLE